MLINEENLAAWKEKYGVQGALKIDELRENKDGSRICTVMSKDGKEIIEVNDGNRYWHLNSRYEPEYAARIYAERYKHAKSFWVYFVFGISDGKHIRELLKQLDETNKVFIYEPDASIFTVSMEYFPLQDIISDPRVYISIDKIEEVGQKAGSLIEYSNRELIEFCILPGYDLLYGELCNRYMDTTIHAIRMALIHKNTYEHFNRKYPYNILYNMKNMLYHNNICQIKERLMELDLSEIPAIVVAAGPSLDKNIHELKKAEGRAFIIVVDAAIKRILKEGIRPDLVVTEDAFVPERFFEAEGMENVFWLAENVSKSEVMQRYGKKVFYFGHTIKYWDKKLIETLGYSYPDMLTGGCVAHTAYGVALYLGFRTIILIGQDLAFTGGKSHTSGIHDEKEENDNYIQSRIVVTVEDENGTLLETDAQMKLYKEWYETDFEKRKDDLLKVIDATEGGAKIKGTIIQPLKQTLQEECQHNIDIWSIENEIEIPFSEKQQERLLQVLEGMEEKTKQLKLKIAGVIEEYKELRQKSIEGVSELEIKNKLEQLAIENDELDHTDFMDLVAYYAKEDEYELQEHIYKDEEIKPEDLADRAIRLYEGYLKGIDMLQEDLTELYGQ